MRGRLLFRLCSQNRGPRLSEKCRQPSLPLRTRDKPDLCGNGQPLRDFVIPARPARPRDKAKVENGVLIAKRWILAVLRHRKFYALAELNAAIAELLGRLNSRALRKIQQSRHQLFLLFDQPNALSLPQKP